jgi:hypothetical protein
VKEYENNGIGRALLSAVMRTLTPSDYPVYLHTQVGSYRAIKLYSDFGFKILKDNPVGLRQNDLSTAIPHLKARMPTTAFNGLEFCFAEQQFLIRAANSSTNDF